jgi:hypothetical protein
VSKETQIALLAALAGLAVALCFCFWLDWAGFLSDRYVPALFGAFVAFIIAFIVYPWQKNFDRKADFRAEQRASLRGYIVEMIALEQQAREIKNPGELTKLGERLMAIDRQSELVAFRATTVASKEQAEVIRRMRREFSNLLQKASGVLEGVSEALKGNGESEVHHKIVDNKLREAFLEWKKKYLVELENLMNLSRELEPFLDGKVCLQSLGADPAANSDEQSTAR